MGDLSKQLLTYTSPEFYICCYFAVLKIIILYKVFNGL